MTPIAVAFLLWLPNLGQDALVLPATGESRQDVPDVLVETVDADDEEDIAEVQLSVIRALRALGHDVRSANVLTRVGDRWVPLPELLPAIEPPPKRTHEMKSAAGGSPVARGGYATGQVPGFLAGKSVYVSAGHGWTWNDGLGRWATQRPNTHDIVEDFVNHEAVHHFLIPLLVNAGATVFPVREPDKNPNLVIADETTAVVTGEWQSGPAGWDPTVVTMKSGTNPFETGATIQTVTAESATASATLEATLPESGLYGVNLSFAAGPDRAADAHVTIHHAGGQTEYVVDQRRHGSTWVFLGRLPFHAGPAKVVWTNQSATAGKIVSVDAVRFGGGMGVVERGNGDYPASGPTSGRPRWEENCRYHAQLQGAPKSVYDASSTDASDDVTCRSRYAGWQHEEGEDAVFVSWHSNAPSPARGTSTWVYGPNPPDGNYIFTGSAGSDALAVTVHEEIIAGIQYEWDPAWKDRGLRSAWFGELNPKHNPDMPATLCEVAFHDTEEDAAYLAEPRFRLTLSRGFYRGIVRYFAERDGVPPQYLPEPPQNLRVRGQPDGSLHLEWDPSEEGQPATGYRIYTSPDGLGFGPTASTEGTEHVLDELTPGDVVYVYVTATSAGGESFRTAVLAGLPSCNATDERALIVQGFTRLDAFSLPTEDLTPWSLGHSMRFDQDVVNTFAYVVEHAEALAALGVAFDSAEAGAISDLGSLSSYALVDWILGEQSTVDETFDAEAQAVVAALAEDGGRLFVSGAEVAWDLHHKGSESDKAFCEAVLKVSMDADSAETHELSTGVKFTAGYDVDFPDVLVAQGGAEPLWTYSTGGVAAVAYSNGDYAVVTAGFPFETVSTAADREAMMAEVLKALSLDGGSLDLCPVVVPPDEGPAPDSGPVPPEPTPEPPPAVEPGPDAGPAAPDVRAPDDGPRARTDTGAISPDLATPEADGGGPSGPPPTQSFAAASDSGGCQTGHRGAAGVALLLLLGLALALRRRSG